MQNKNKNSTSDNTSFLCDNLTIKDYEKQELPQMCAIWNEIVKDGNAFPQTNCLSIEEGDAFFSSQTLTRVIKAKGKVLGLYILHPNNIGRCSHIANASYAIEKESRGLHLGERLVKDCLFQAKKKGFLVLQFNAVVESNISARHLYEKLGFTQLGVIPKGFCLPSGEYENICPYIKEL